jgi:hypothetical protein
MRNRAATSEFDDLPADDRPVSRRERLTRPWVVALASAVVAGITALVALWLLHTVSPRDDFGLFVRLEGPRSALVFFAAYGALALLLIAAIEIFDLLRVRSRLRQRDGDGDGDTNDDQDPSHNWWHALFDGTSLTRLADRILDLAPADIGLDDRELLMQSRFDPQQARHEIVCHYRDRLVLGQFATALLLVAILAGLGAAQDYAHASLAGFSVPAETALIALAALAVIAVAARIAVGAAAEPLIDAIAQLRLPRLELRLLSLLAAGAAHSDTPVQQAPAPVSGISAAIDLPVERLAAALEENQEVLRDAVSRLAASTTALSAAARSITERPRDARPQGDAAASSQLRQAIAKLATAIEGLPTAAAPASAARATPAAADTAPRRRRAGQQGDLGSALRRLIEDFE